MKHSLVWAAAPPVHAQLGISDAISQRKVHCVCGPVHCDTFRLACFSTTCLSTVAATSSHQFLLVVRLSDLCARQWKPRKCQSRSAPKTLKLAAHNCPRTSTRICIQPFNTDTCINTARRPHNLSTSCGMHAYHTTSRCVHMTSPGICIRSSPSS
jgi:hypothetical protein